MKKNPQKRTRKNKKIILSVFFVILIILATVIILQVFNHNQTRSNTALQTETDENKVERPKTPTTDQTQRPEDGTKADAEAGRTPKTPEQYQGQDVNQLEKLTGAITYSAKTSDEYRLRVNIDQFLKLPGTCKLTLISAGKVVYTETVSVIPNPSSGSCEGFDVPLSQLPSGAYHVKIEITANQKTGTIEGEATI